MRTWRWCATLLVCLGAGCFGDGCSPHIEPAGAPVDSAQPPWDAAGGPAYDIIVYGGTSAGMVAAVQASRMGKRTIVIEPTQHIGGASASGLGMTDTGDTTVIGGLSREFYARLKAHYDQPESWTLQVPSSYPDYRPSDNAIWRFEPHVAEAVFQDMIEEARVPVVLGERLDLQSGVEKMGTTIISIRMESGRVFRGRMFIDATYEGDLMAKAGVTYTIGREANSTYGETLNGVETAKATNHQFTTPIDSYVISGDPSSGLLLGIQSGAPGTDGEGDRRIQAYNFRLCLTKVDANRIPFPKPEEYAPARYELLLRYVNTGARDVFGNNQQMPNLKTDMNNNGPFSTDNIGMNYEYPDGDYATRDKIIRDHVTYQQGLLYFLANDSRVPADLAATVAAWGLAKDEFVDTGNWPPALYVREARRMVSDYVHTEQDCRSTRLTPEAVGMGSYNMDSHNVQRYADSTGHARNEGDVEASPGGPYAISYRSIRPQPSECTNLLVPVTISASHIAYGSVRMEPVFMILGQSAATAAAIAIDSENTVQGLDYIALRRRLLQDGQVLAGGEIDPSWLEGVVVDDAQATLTGNWTTSSVITPFVGTGYQHDDNTDKGAKSAKFAPILPTAGNYDVRFAYTSAGNRATNVPVVVYHAAGVSTTIVNEQTPPPIDRTFVSLGTFSFGAGEASIAVSNAGTDGYVIIDAIELVPTQ